VTRWLTIAAFVLLPLPATAEWQIKPFAGVVFGGSTSFVDPEVAAGKAHFLLGASAGVLGEVFGLEGDVARVPGFFQSDVHQFVLSSSVTTLTGNVVVAMPKRLSQYTLRPYFVAGAGILHARTESKFGTLPLSRTLPAIDVGGGVTGFLNDRVGLNWEIRHFRSVGRGETGGVSVSGERLAFWRVTTAVAIGY
jgi:hypothetical protein